jgi:hypothetical protein
LQPIEVFGDAPIADFAEPEDAFENAKRMLHTAIPPACTRGSTLAGCAPPTSFAGHPSASYKPNRQIT